MTKFSRELRSIRKFQVKRSNDSKLKIGFLNKDGSVQEWIGSVSSICQNHWRRSIRSVWSFIYRISTCFRWIISTFSWFLQRKRLDSSIKKEHLVLSKCLICVQLAFIGANISFFDGCVNVVVKKDHCRSERVMSSTDTMNDHWRWTLSFIVDCPRVTSGWEECISNYVLLSLTPMDSWEYVDASKLFWVTTTLIDWSIDQFVFLFFSFSFSHLLLFVFIPRILRFVVAYFYIGLFLPHFSFLADQHVSCEQQRRTYGQRRGRHRFRFDFDLSRCSSSRWPKSFDALSAWRNFAMRVFVHIARNCAVILAFE